MGQKNFSNKKGEQNLLAFFEWYESFGLVVQQIKTAFDKRSQRFAFEHVLGNLG